ncbi:MAG: hypothetical protein U9N39_02390 [Campylobacterota bacterium]|nr:hypothetical protein [Campylobacterota bacterium]
MFAILKKIFFYLLLAYAFIGFIVLPYLIKPKIIELVSQETDAKVEIETLYINPFLFKVKISDVVLSSLDDIELVRFKELCKFRKV